MIAIEPKNAVAAHAPIFGMGLNSFAAKQNECAFLPPWGRNQIHKLFALNNLHKTRRPISTNFVAFIAKPTKLPSPLHPFSGLHVLTSAPARFAARQERHTVKRPAGCELQPDFSWVSARPHGRIAQNAQRGSRRTSRRQSKDPGNIC